MKCLVLAAGYATRLYPLTKNFPKPLLDVSGKSILDRLVSDVDTIENIDEIIIVSNHKFIDIFGKWLDESKMRYSRRITLLDDGSTCNEDRLGAVRDIAFVIEKLGIDDDLMVIAGDNLLDFSFSGFADFFQNKNGTCIMCHYEPEVEKLRKTGVAIIDDDSRVIEMQEKPYDPKSNWAVPPFYIYRREDLGHIIDGVNSGSCATDAPGSFISWFCTKCDVFAYRMPGKRYDIGDMESYERAQKEFDGK